MKDYFSPNGIRLWNRTTQLHVVAPQKNSKLDENEEFLDYYKGFNEYLPIEDVDYCREKIVAVWTSWEL
jgi:hypothetical protein